MFSGYIPHAQEICQELSFPTVSVISHKYFQFSNFKFYLNIPKLQKEKKHLCCSVGVEGYRKFKWIYYFYMCQMSYIVYQDQSVVANNLFTQKRPLVGHK
jgi:hypothetical protein